MTTMTEQKRVRWGNGGEWCNLCGTNKAVWSGLCLRCHKLPEPRTPAVLALAKIVKEYKITRRQARELRRIREYTAARAQRRCADVYMKCARILRDL